MDFSACVAYYQAKHNTMAQHERKIWVDCLRLLAIFLVVVSHCGDPFTFNPNPEVSTNAALGFWGAIWQSWTHICVPLFVCMSGILLLPVSESMTAFWKKRISRVLWPFLIWSVLYNLYPVIAIAFGATPELISHCFSSAEHPSGAMSDALLCISRIPIDFTPYTTHMWYVFLIIGLYLYLPIFSSWVAQASRKEKLLVLCLWGMTLFLPLAGQYSERLFGTCEWNTFGMLYYFSGFSGYLLLGHIVAESKPMSWGRTVAVALPLYAVGYLLTFFGYRIIQTGAITSGSSFCDMLAAAADPSVPGLPYEESHELMLLCCSPNVAIMTLAVLLVFRHFNRVPTGLGAALKNMTACGFGIYLVHYFFVGPASIICKSIGIPIWAEIPVAALIAFPLTWLCVVLLRKLIPGKWLLG